MPRHQQFFTPQEVAARLQISMGTLANWRSQGKGPPYLKVGRAVRYSAPDLAHWERQSFASQNFGPSSYRGERF